MLALVLHLQHRLQCHLFSQRSRKPKRLNTLKAMSQTSTIVHSISSSKTSAAAPAKPAKNLAVPLALLLGIAVSGAPKSPRACLAPTAAPTVAPTVSGLYKPTAAPTSDRKPTAAPTTQDLKTPTAVPTTAVPTTECKPTAAPAQEL